MKNKAMRFFAIVVIGTIMIFSVASCSKGDAESDSSYMTQNDEKFKPTLDEIGLLADQAGLGSYWDTIKQQIRPGFYMVPKIVDEEQIGIGTSKIGGHPDVPASFIWPSWKGHPMSFLAQINLEEFPMASVNPEYPVSGILYFFYVYDYELWYDNPKFDSQKKKNNLVFYTADTSQLIRMNPPDALTDEQVFKSGIIEKKLELTIPDGDYLQQNKILKKKDVLDKYSLIFKSKFQETYDVGIGYRFLGHMTALQYGGYPKKDILLFQADSNQDVGMEWDLSGLLYFFINEDDFKKLSFKNVYTERVGT
ncbi:YwqG family protein [Paenibacillus glycanilyticus]|uniref:YwqG family protein n=1 Tax=Paenibacillus glycanilyticus TaxID=126569 RepID=UPI003EBFB615